MTETLADLREIAEAAALVGGRMARAAFGQRHAVSIKPDASEVTETDVATERAVIEHILTRRPVDLFIGEENVSARDERAAIASDLDAVTWVIDPIDGTRNFIRGVPLFTCSVAALRGGMPVAAAIYEPMGDVLYSAHAGGGATRRTGSEAGSATTTLQIDQNIATRANMTPIVAVPSAWIRRSGPFVRSVYETSVVRSLGCATLHLLMIATGGVDGTFMNNCKLWDIAAGWLIATEAGARVTTPEGLAQFPIDTAGYHGEEMPTLAAGAAFHGQLVERWKAVAEVKNE